MSENKDSNKNAQNNSENNQKQNPIAAIINATRDSIVIVDKTINGIIASLCLSNKISPHFSISFICASVGTSLTIAIVGVLSLISYNISPDQFFSDISSQSIGVYAGLGIISTLWFGFMAIISHNDSIILCEAFSRGVRATLYPLIVYYVINIAGNIG